MEIIDTIKYKGYHINIHSDFDPINPIEDWDMLGTMVCCHSRYTLGHKQYDNGPDAIYYPLTDEFYNTDTLQHDYEWMDSNKFIDKYMAKLEQFAIVMPLYLYDHSGITISTTPFSCPWDSGQIGFIYVSNKAVKEEWGWKYLTKSRRNKILNIFKNEVKIYDDYLRGNVYGYVIEETDDSCWGFFGDDWENNALMEYAKNSIDCDIATKHRIQLQEDQQIIGDMSQLIY